MNSRDSLMTARFLLNMERISGLVKLVMSNVDVLKVPALFQSSEGPRADILRAIVVFLHATFEDVLRSQVRRDNKNWAFYSGADIDKVLRKSGVDPSPFKALYPPLSQMAKRRKRIVHEADLAKKTDSATEAWTIADDWQLVMWLLAVPAFHSLLCMSIDHEDQVARQKYLKLREAMDGFVAFGKQIIALSETPPDLQQRLNALQKLSDTLNSVSTLVVASKTVSERRPVRQRAD
jgi:hypothetical protein